MNDSFSALHPALTFCYFAAVLLLTMLVLHPVFLALSLLGALGYCAVLRGWRSLGRTLGWLVPFLVLMAALNALFNHAGVTMLFYLPNGNPVTREALCYGAAAAAMFAAVILWFQCCNVVMTAEKYLYVFGSALPGVSLLLSMALRFIPKFSAHIRAVRGAGIARLRHARGQRVAAAEKMARAFCPSPFRGRLRAASRRRTP